MKNKKKIIILTSIIIGVLVVTLGITYAAYNFTRLGTTQQLVLGDIYMNYDETNELSIENAMPSNTYDSSKYFEFTISGKNTYTEKDIWYEVVLSHGASHATRTERIKDNLLKFTLIEIKDGNQTVVVDGASYEDLTNQRIWVNTIGKNTTTKTTITYRLYMWISPDTKVGNTSEVDYDMNTWNNQVYGSIKVNVTGDFEEKELAKKTGAEYIISTLNTGGLVAVNTSGTLYDGTGEIREYRYSGPSVNNYIIFNDDGDSTTEANELWRIVGVFKNSEGNWNLKLMRDTVLTSNELPATYTINGTSFNIENGTSGRVYWNSTKTGTNENDWTTAGLQYFLNTKKDDNGTAGYYSTFTTNAKKLIDENYEYNLGNVYISSTTIEAYEAERGTTICSSSVTSNSQNSNCNIWNGNKETWNGAIGLLYPSDYGYSVNSEYWNVMMTYLGYNTAQSDGIIPKNTSWMQTTANHSSWEWLLSPSSDLSESVVGWYEDGIVAWNPKTFNCGVRGVLNLKSHAMIDSNHEGSSTDPYVVIES